jgi:hypothetical protein
MSFDQKPFHKEKHFVVTFAGKVLFITKNYEKIEQYFASPNTCPHHQNDIVPNIHNDCWEQYEKVQYKHVKILSNDVKYFLSQPANFLISQFGHIWHQYYYRLFNVLFHIKDKGLKNSSIFLLGSHIDGNFTPQNPYYKNFTEGLMNDFGIKDYYFNDEPTIYEVDNFWATNGDYGYDIKRINEYLFKGTVEPWRKVYATKSLWFGKWKTPRYLLRSTNTPIVSLHMPREVMYSDKGYDSIFEALIEQDVLTKRIYNENELEEFLQSYGFECIDPAFQFHKEECIEYTLLHNDNLAHKRVKCVGGCSIEENIKYFSEVKTLVSISSSALQNMIFMDPHKSNIIELETKFSQVNGLDVNQKFMDIGADLESGAISPDTFSEACNQVLRNFGEYHPWHPAMAHELGIGYSQIQNIDLNSRTLINKIKRDPKVLDIISQ